MPVMKTGAFHFTAARIDTTGKPLIAHQYKQAAATLCRSRYGILGALLIYTASCIGGWWFSDALGFFQQAASGLVGKFETKAGINFVLSLFLHNLVATYITMCLVTLWGLVPLITAVANGLLLGWIVTVVTGQSIIHTAMMLVPHGLFEWPAMLIAWGVGFWRGAGYRFDTAPGTYLDRWLAANRVYCLIVLPLLLVAAIIEGRVHLFNALSG